MYCSQASMRKCDICPCKFDKTRIAASLMFFDSICIRDHLGGSRNQWDDGLEAVLKLGSIRNGEE